LETCSPLHTTADVLKLERPRLPLINGHYYQLANKNTIVTLVIIIIIRFFFSSLPFRKGPRPRTLWKNIHEGGQLFKKDKNGKEKEKKRRLVCISGLL
jgi:hypothetical protein